MKATINFLLHKVNKAKYWYISQQIPVNGEYRHKHVGRIKQLDCKNRENIKDRVATYMFIPNMNIFDLPKDELKRLKGYIESNFKNVKWALNYNLILDGVKVQAKQKVKQTEKVKELVYQS